MGEKVSLSEGGNLPGSQEGRQAKVTCCRWRPQRLATERLDQPTHGRRSQSGLYAYPAGPDR